MTELELRMSGWSPEEKQEVYEKVEIIEKFYEQGESIEVVRGDKQPTKHSR